MREAVYSDIYPQLHDREMEWLFNSGHAACFLAWSETGAPAGLLEITLRNVVDGYIGSAVGYIDGLYLAPDHHGIALNWWPLPKMVPESELQQHRHRR